MNNAAYVDNLVAQMKTQGKTKTEIIITSAEACVGWPYVWGATGQNCTPAKREAFLKRESEAEASVTVKKCQVLNGSKSSCDGCKYYPSGCWTLMEDCQGFVKKTLKRIGITMKGGGCSSMWKDNSNWTQKGEIATLPEKLCCVFWQNAKNKSVMDHIGFYIGNGYMVHCSGEVKKEKLSKKCTHWAIPVGLEGEIPVTFPTLRKGSKGEYVTLLQTKLIQQGYDLEPYGADGSFGAKTQSAVKAFQKNHNLNADGIVGPKTWEALNNTEPVEWYTVTVPHLTPEQANILLGQYPDAVRTKEK